MSADAPVSADDPAESAAAAPMTVELDELFERNRRWAAATEKRSPGFFSRLAAQQAPQYLWIGCADSRVPANELVDLMPGEVFVHRNIANVVAHGDLNCLSVVQFATDALQVRHIIVVGHSRCGGVTAVLKGQRVGLVDHWLRYVHDVRDKHAGWLETVAPERQVDALGELNVIEQARHLCETTVVRDAWERGHALTVHGWFYGLNDGLLGDLGMTVSSRAEVEAVHERAIAGVHRRHGPGGDNR